MRLSGLHFLLTYECNCKCAHCFLSCGPQRTGEMSAKQIKEYIDQAKDIPTINYFFIEGGEPFLNSKVALEAVKYAGEKGYWIGILSNGFWAKTLEKGIGVLKPFKDAGLGEIGISTDKFHQEKVPIERAANAVAAAERLDIPVSVMATTGSKKEIKEIKKFMTGKGIKAQVWASSVKGRGRGSLICEGKPTKWQKLTECGENLKDPGRVHIGPEGAVHLCQNLLIGENAKNVPLKQLFENYQKSKHPIIKLLIEGGPAALAKWAADNFGFKPKNTYLQACQLCFETRCFLSKNFPADLGPRENY